MAPSRPIPVVSPANGDRRGSFVGLVSSLGASFVNPSPLAHEAVLRDVASLNESELEADERLAASAAGGGGGGGGGLASGAATDYDSNDSNDSDSDSLGDGAPDLYRRPSGIAYGTSRPAVGLAPIAGPPLSRLERKQSRNAERSLLRDNHLLPPKHAVGGVGVGVGVGGVGVGVGGAANAVAADRLSQPGFLGRLYKRMFSTKVPLRTTDEERMPAMASDGATTPFLSTTPSSNGSFGDYTSAHASTDERTALLLPPPAAAAAPLPNPPPLAGEPVSHRHLDEQWEAAVAAGQIHTTWQREAQTIAVYSRSLILTFLLQYSINITSIFAVGHIGKVELGAVSCELD